MDAHLPDDLKALEQRLASWGPSRTALNSDRMLFAAGQASARPGKSRLLWPAVAIGLALLSALLGIGLARERAGRLALVRRLSTPPPARSPVPSLPRSLPLVAPDDPVASAALPVTAYLVTRRALEQGPDAWPQPSSPEPVPPGPPPSPILQAGNHRALLGP